ncbi:hypothetical protein ACFQ1E_20325 [Sphingomonas canadensis]|uniref:Uncharacterized protein n=1 Tax=Sphingomonas canadensis TaxID=1219257 RepID=A0ABW3HBA5_9SPHN|nr:hypothetical protein [Sphingomonas canadensis]MCW3838395.1 hypothetical protein [Sphingomonas canadensis]
MNEYTRSAQEEREYRRLRYPGSDVLINKLNCRTQEELDEAERLIVTARLSDNLPPAARRFDVAGLRAVRPSHTATGTDSTSCSMPRRWTGGSRFGRRKT